MTVYLFNSLALECKNQCLALWNDHFKHELPSNELVSRCADLFPSMHNFSFSLPAKFSWHSLETCLFLSCFYFIIRWDRAPYGTWHFIYQRGLPNGKDRCKVTRLHNCDSTRAIIDSYAFLMAIYMDNSPHGSLSQTFV